MTHAELCPKCQGEGMIWPYMNLGNTAKITCNICNGTGYLVLGD